MASLTGLREAPSRVTSSPSVGRGSPGWRLRSRIICLIASRIRSWLVGEGVRGGTGPVELMSAL